MAKLKNILTQDTFKQYWISSGTTPSLISAAIISGSETVISSGTGVSSGNGHYYRTASVNTQGYYISEWKATISGSPYRRRVRFKAVLNEVD
jgi:Ni/Fe-hydrogenase subunit HybB-like protein